MEWRDYQCKDWLATPGKDDLEQTKHLMGSLEAFRPATIIDANTNFRK
jgi:hypothetical protein